MASERIQKILARAGIASRRKAEELITLGQVTVNGRPVKLGDKAELGQDAIKVNGKLIHQVESLAYFLFFKPRGVLSTLSDPEKRPTLSEFVARIGQRVYPVGRLDFNSDGALLLTNDGALAEQIQKGAEFPRIYHVKVKGHPSDEVLERLRSGAKVGHRLLKPHSVRLLSPLQSKSEVEFVVLGSGVFDVRAYFETKGLLVDRVTRFGIGQLTIRGMTPGQLRPLVKSQLDALINQPELGLQKIESETEANRDRIERFQEKSAAGARIKPRAEGAPAPASLPRSEFKPRREGFKPRGKDFKPRSGGDSFKPRSEGYKPRSDSFKPRSEGYKPRSEGFKPRSEGYKPRSEGFKSRSEGYKPRSEGFKSRSEGYKHRSEGYKPRSEGFKSRSEGYKPRSEGFKPRSGGDSFRPRSEGYKPRSEGFKSRSAGFKPRGPAKPGRDSRPRRGAIKITPKGS